MANKDDEKTKPDTEYDSELDLLLGGKESKFVFTKEEEECGGQIVSKISQTKVIKKNIPQKRQNPFKLFGQCVGHVNDSKKQKVEDEEEMISGATV